jgi:hypothetical protein
MRLGIYIWRAPYTAALARTKDGDKWNDLHGQVERALKDMFVWQRMMDQIPLYKELQLQNAK